MKKRIEHIDAFRGLCIFAVVYLHIILFCGLNTYQSSPIQVILKDFFLVGFYFISGFLSYKNDDTISSLINLRDFIVKKIKTLLIPSITIMALYCIIVMGSIKILWTPWNLWITWFTYVLFSINLIYAIISFIS